MVENIPPKGEEPKRRRQKERSEKKKASETQSWYPIRKKDDDDKDHMDGKTFFSLCSLFSPLTNPFLVCLEFFMLAEHHGGVGQHSFFPP